MDNKIQKEIYAEVLETLINHLNIGETEQEEYVDKLVEVDKLMLRIKFDDGFIAYLNGI